MKTIHAVSCVCYTCPRCQSENILPIQQTINRSFKCSKCHARWTAGELITRDWKHFNPLVLQFTCLRCNTTNTIFTPIKFQRTYALESESGLKIQINSQGGPRPTYGLCETCFAEYELVMHERSHEDQHLN